MPGEANMSALALRRLAVCASMVVLVGPPSGPNAAWTGRPDAQTAVAALYGEYRGMAAVTIQHCDLDEYGDANCGARKTYRRAVSVFIRAPERCGAVRDTNPLTLHIATDQDPDNPQDGEFWLLSGGRTYTPGSRCVVLTLWELTLRGKTISGTLTTDGGVNNRVWAMAQIAPDVELVWPFGVDIGATLRGTLGADEIAIRIRGKSVDHTRLFVVDLKARRAQ
jgi:hypothetical protein